MARPWVESCVLRTLEVAEVRLLVELSLPEIEGFDDVVDLLGRVIELLGGLLGGGIGASVCNKPSPVSDSLPCSSPRPSRCATF